MSADASKGAHTEERLRRTREQVFDLRAAAERDEEANMTSRSRRNSYAADTIESQLSRLESQAAENKRLREALEKAGKMIGVELFARGMAGKGVASPDAAAREVSNGWSAMLEEIASALRSVQGEEPAP